MILFVYRPVYRDQGFNEDGQGGQPVIKKLILISSYSPSFILLTNFFLLKLLFYLKISKAFSNFSFSQFSSVSPTSSVSCVLFKRGKIFVKFQFEGLQVEGLSDNIRDLVPIIDHILTEKVAPNICNCSLFCKPSWVVRLACVSH